MKLERTVVSTEMFLNALYGMRNPMNSWSKFDSKITNEGLVLGDNDRKLASTLIKSGTDHSKFMRQIAVSVNITAPEYWWPEMDQYKVGTVTNSTSKMHKLLSKEITQDCFQEKIGETTLARLENLRIWALKERELGVSDGNNKWWCQLLNELPLGWLQTRMWTANYQVLRNIYHARKNHKQVCWHIFCDWINTLPESWMITDTFKEEK